MGVPGALFALRAALLFATLACASGCGPGRNSRRYRSPEPRTPMVLRQHEPQTDEHSPFASGRSEGRVTRDDRRFLNLIPVYDDDIVIQDAEGTGHDRMMTEVEGCGPGRGLGRPGNRMKLTPLVFKQHVPNVSEFTLGASGLSERRITRTDPRFRNLVPVYSDDIIFRDEEGTGADRFMTQRCVEKLKALAISVMNQWPSLKLRVVDGWIENVRPGYPNDSLHYEGRAVDITTSDRDRSKIGMLARLAVEAGFDWVYYETKAHIHCSVKSESSQGARTGGCFTDEGTVVVEGGARKKLSEVRLGDRVLSYDTGSDKLVYSEVIMFLDRDTTARKQFLRLELSGGQVLTVTPQHLVMRNRPNATDQDVEAVFAAHLKPSDQLLVAENNGTRLVRRTLLSSELVLDMGVIAPLTSVGTIVVDDVIASCYAVIESQSIAHFAFAPLRAVKSIEAGLGAVGRLLSSPFVSSTNSAPSSTTKATLDPTKNTISYGTNEGVHWYPKTLYYLSNHFIPSYLLYN